MTQNEVLEYLKRHGDGTAHDIATELGKNSGSISQNIMKLQYQNLIKHIGYDKGRRVWKLK